jgi:hypothetical protein
MDSVLLGPAERCLVPSPPSLSAAAVLQWCGDVSADEQRMLEHRVKDGIKRIDVRMDPLSNAVKDLRNARELKTAHPRVTRALDELHKRIRLVRESARNLR